MNAADTGRPTGEAPRVLIIDEDRQAGSRAEKVLSDAGCKVYWHTVPEAALQWYDLNRDSVDVALIDMIREQDGINHVRRMKVLNQDQTIALISSGSSWQDIETALRCGADTFFAKPLEFSRIISWLNEVSNAEALE